VQFSIKKLQTRQCFSAEINFITVDDSMIIRINGKPESLVPGISIEMLLPSRGLDPACVVVELNRAIVKKECFSSTVLKDGDVVEILRFVGGG
jgi:sulfur carrier protein